MSTPTDRILHAHPTAGPAWYLALARAVGGVLALPGLRRWRPLARRLHVVTETAGRVTVLSEPGGRRPPQPRWLTVLSANLWHDWPRQERWPERLEAFAQLVEQEGADIVLLQEAARTATLHADRWLAARLGLATVYARANGAVEAIGFEEGPAILSRYPLGDIHLRQLSHGHNPLVRRVALGAHVATPHGPLLLVSVHLGLLQRHNAGQIRRLRAWVAEISGGEAAVIGGDFNAPEHGPEIARTQRMWTDTYRHAYPENLAVTHTRARRWGGLLQRRLDYVFVQQPPAWHWRVVDAGHLEAPGGPHSDHRAVLARLLPDGVGPVRPASTAGRQRR